MMSQPLILRKIIKFKKEWKEKGKRKAESHIVLDVSAVYPNMKKTLESIHITENQTTGHVPVKLELISPGPKAMSMICKLNLT